VSAFAANGAVDGQPLKCMRSLHPRLGTNHEEPLLDDHLRLYEQQAVPPLTHEAPHRDPEAAVAAPDAPPLHVPFQDGRVVAQGGVVVQQLVPVTNGRVQETQESGDHLQGHGC
jgi:hypothetical protein